MFVKRLESPREEIQCQLPKEDLNPATIGWKGYRENRAKRKSNGFDPQYCLRVASWQIGDKLMCTQHAGIKALEHLAK